MAKSPPWGGKSPAPVPTPAQGTGLGSLLQLAELQLPGELFPRSSNDRNAAPQLCPPFSQAGSEVLSPSSSFCNPTAHPTHTRLLPPGAEQLTGDARGRAAPVPPQNVTQGPGADALSAADATFTAPRRRQSSAQLAASLHGELEPGWAARGGGAPSFPGDFTRRRSSGVWDNRSFSSPGTKAEAQAAIAGCSDSPTHSPRWITGCLNRGQRSGMGHEGSRRAALPHTTPCCSRRGA